MRDAPYYPQPPYPGVPWRQPQPPPPAPARPERPWPLRVVNLWMSGGVIAITLLAVLLAILAPSAVSAPPSTGGFTLDYQSSLTHNSSGSKAWDVNPNCQFTDSGYVVTAPDPNQEFHCFLQGGSYQNFLLRVQVVDAGQVAVIGFLANDRLAISGDGRFLFYQSDPLTGAPQFLLPVTCTHTLTCVGAGSVALHPTGLGVSERTNEITIQVQQQTYSFYANGQLLASYNAPTLESPGQISLGTAGGATAEFSDITIYVPDSSA